MDTDDVVSCPKFLVQPSDRCHMRSCPRLEMTGVVQEYKGDEIFAVLFLDARSTKDTWKVTIHVRVLHCALLMFREICHRNSINEVRVSSELDRDGNIYLDRP